MRKAELENKVESFNSSTKEAIILILDSLNQGQRKKVLKVPEVKALCDRYGITE